MRDFQKYMHVERYGNDEVQGIELGKCYVFPKIDGTNASVWMDNDEIRCGSRNRELSIDSDNAGFLNAMILDDEIIRALSEIPNIRLYGEWLVPHSLKTYRDDAWRKFYIFDVWSDDKDSWIPYDEYSEMLKPYELNIISPMAVINNATYDNLLREVNQNGFLIVDGKGVGEGVVIKNYNFANRFGNVVWAKIVTNEFKERNKKEFGHKEINGTKMVEQDIVDEFITEHLVNKVFAKIANEREGWNSKYIPRLLSTVYHDLVSEEIWGIVKKMKNPTINFKTLSTLTTIKIKEIRQDLF